MKNLCYNILMQYTRAYFGDILPFFQECLVKGVQKSPQIFADFAKNDIFWHTAVLSSKFSGME